MTKNACDNYKVFNVILFIYWVILFKQEAVAAPVTAMFFLTGPLLEI